jgi:hypothetical protein
LTSLEHADIIAFGFGRSSLPSLLVTCRTYTCAVWSISLCVFDSNLQWWHHWVCFSHSSGVCRSSDCGSSRQFRAKIGRLQRLGLKLDFKTRRLIRRTRRI